METNGASTLENIAKGKYTNALTLWNLLKTYLKVYKEESEREGNLKQIEKDKAFLDKICKKINESKGNSVDILYSDDFSIKDALEGANISQEDSERFTSIVDDYIFDATVDYEYASRFSRILTASGIPHEFFTFDQEKLNKDGTKETTPVPVLMASHKYLKEIEAAKNFIKTMTDASRSENINCAKEETKGRIPYKQFIKEVADINNMSITVPEKMFLMDEFNFIMANANKKFTIDPNNKNNIIVPINDYAFAKAAIESDIYSAIHTILGNYSRLEAGASEEKRAELTNAIEILRQNKSNECIYIYNGSDLNDKSFIKVPAFGPAELYLYHPNDKENPFVKTKDDIEYNEDPYKFVKNIFSKKSQNITKGVKQGITFVTSADIDAKASKEEQKKQIFEVIKQLDKKYDKNPATVINRNDPKITYRISLQQKYDKEINSILKFINNKNYSAIKDNLNKLLVNQALIKILNAYDVNKSNVEKILEEVNNKSLAMGGQTFDLKSLIEENSIASLKEKEQTIKNAIINACEESQQQDARQTLINIFNTTYSAKDEKDLENIENISKKDLKNIISGTDLAIAIEVVNHRIEASEIAKNLKERSLNQTLDKVIEEKGLGMDSRDENETEKEDPII